MQARIGNPSDIEGILALQKSNLYSELTAAERTKGFVTTPFTIPQIEEIIEEDGIFVVEIEAKSLPMPLQAPGNTSSSGQFSPS